MKMELIQPFINSADAVLSQMLQAPTSVGNLTMEEEAYRRKGGGAIAGEVILKIAPTLPTVPVQVELDVGADMLRLGAAEGGPVGAPGLDQRLTPYDLGHPWRLKAAVWREAAGPGLHLAFVGGPGIARIEPPDLLAILKTHAVLPFPVDRRLHNAASLQGAPRGVGRRGLVADPECGRCCSRRSLSLTITPRETAFS